MNSCEDRRGRPASQPASYFYFYFFPNFAWNEWGVISLCPVSALFYFWEGDPSAFLKRQTTSVLANFGLALTPQGSPPIGGRVCNHTSCQPHGLKCVSQFSTAVVSRFRKASVRPWRLVILLKYFSTINLYRFILDLQRNCSTLQQNGRGGELTCNGSSDLRPSQNCHNCGFEIWQPAFFNGCWVFEGVCVCVSVLWLWLSTFLTDVRQAKAGFA